MLYRCNFENTPER